MEALTVAVVAGLIGVLGTLLGAVVTTRMDREAERIRWTRDQSRRWDSNKRELYGRFLGGLERMLEAATELAVPEVAPDGPSSPADRFWQVDLEVRQALAEITLIAPEAVSTLAAVAHGKFVGFGGEAYDSEGAGLEDLEGKLYACNQARSAFVEACREDLLEAASA